MADGTLFGDSETFNFKLGGVLKAQQGASLTSSLQNLQERLIEEEKRMKITQPQNPLKEGHKEFMTQLEQWQTQML